MKRQQALRHCCISYTSLISPRLLQFAAGFSFLIQTVAADQETWQKANSKLVSQTSSPHQLYLRKLSFISAISYQLGHHKARVTTDSQTINFKGVCTCTYLALSALCLAVNLGIYLVPDTQKGPR